SSSEPGWMQSVVRARAIHRPLALKLAKKGGVVDLWPISVVFRTLAAYADALIETAELLGAEHVGVGTDMEGLPGSVIPRYEQFPQLAEILAKRGVRGEDLDNMLGGNYLRVLAEALQRAAPAVN